ncbi:MAG: MerR family transcriptional regulator [Firmicutes bacterium]|nr:MerR family transcriptional regulator [Bacillota bacterium]
MFRIGEFSKLSYVSTKALRFYDELGLLKPDKVDPATGYRFYSAKQMPRLNRIIALKDLGFSLEQIGLLISGKISTDQIKGILKAKRAEIEKQIVFEHERLSRVETRLNMIDVEEKEMGNIDVVLKKVDAQKVIGLRGVVENYPAVGGLFEKLCKTIMSKGGNLEAPGIAVYYDTEYKEKDVDVEAAMPTTGFELNSDGIKTYTLASIENAACLIHHGPYNTLFQSYGILMKWIEENGYRIAGPGREVYLQCTDTGAKDENDCITEIQFPVEKN